MADSSHLDAMGQMADAVALFTGIRQQFLDAGWTPEHAEQLVIEIYRHTPPEGASKP